MLKSLHYEFKCSASSSSSTVFFIYFIYFLKGGTLQTNTSKSAIETVEKAVILVQVNNKYTRTSS